MQNKKLLNLLLLISFVITVLAPVTGIVVHKTASAVFLLLCIIHTAIYRKRLKRRAVLMLLLILTAFFSGLFGMIFDELPVILILHRVISIGCVFVLAIHIFIYHRRMG